MQYGGSTLVVATVPSGINFLLSETVCLSRFAVFLSVADEHTDNHRWRGQNRQSCAVEWICFCLVVSKINLRESKSQMKMSSAYKRDTTERDETKSQLSSLLTGVSSRRMVSVVNMLLSVVVNKKLTSGWLLKILIQGETRYVLCQDLPVKTFSD